MANFEEMAAVEARKKDEQKDSLPRWVIPTIVAVSVASLITIIAAVVTKLLVSCHVMAMFPTYKTISRRKYKVKSTLTLISAQHERVSATQCNQLVCPRCETYSYVAAFGGQDFYPALS